MVIDWILIMIALASFGYAGFSVVKKFPHAASINVKTVPEHRQTVIKRQILEDKLKRDLTKRWASLKSFVLGSRTRRAGRWFGKWYDKVRDLEREYRRTLGRSLSSQVRQTHSINDLLTAARDFLDSEEYAKAEAALIEALKLDEHNVKAFTLLAQVYRVQGKYDQARETLEYILRLTNSADPGVFRSLGEIARARGDLRSAQDDYLRSIALDPNNHNYYLELAEVYRLLEQNDKALESAQQSYALAPNNPKILDFLIETSILLQDKNRASEYLAQLIDVNPQNGKIESLKERIAAIKATQG